MRFQRLFIFFWVLYLGGLSLSSLANERWIISSSFPLSKRDIVVGSIHFLFQDSPNFFSKKKVHVEPNQQIFCSDFSISDLDSDWAFPLLGLSRAWKFSRGRGVIVAILDTGIELKHPDLHPNLWRNYQEDWLDPNTPGYNGIDDDKNGIVDDYYGYNALDNSGDIRDDNGHGTAMAQVIAGACNRRCGVAPEVKILPIKVLDNEGYGYISSVIKGLAYALYVQQRTHMPLLLNLSFTLPYPSLALKDAIKEACRNGVKIFVTAAGNEGFDLNIYPLYPAAFGLPEVVTVASLSPDLHLSWFSNYSTSLVDLAAPGENILICPARGICKTASGTSLATAYVTGILALITARLPQATPWELKSILLKGAIHSPDLETLIREGRIAHAERALKLALGFHPADLSQDGHLDFRDYFLLLLKFW